jgi:hypothetical protein
MVWLMTLLIWGKSSFFLLNPGWNLLIYFYQNYIFKKIKLIQINLFISLVFFNEIKFKL